MKNFVQKSYKNCAKNISIMCARRRCGAAGSSRRGALSAVAGKVLPRGEMPAFAGMTIAESVAVVPENGTRGADGGLDGCRGEMPAFAGMTAWAIGRCGAWRILAAGSSSRLHRTGRQPSCWARHPRNEGWSRSRNGRARPSARAPAPKWDPA